MLFGLRSVIDCEYSISAGRVMYAIGFEHSQRVSERNLVVLVDITTDKIKRSHALWICCLVLSGSD